MNVETEESKARAPPPPPPPPPPTTRSLTTSQRSPAMNHSLTNGGDGRSKLLADICKGTALKKISVTDKNHNDRKLNHNIGNTHDVSGNSLQIRSCIRYCQPCEIACSNILHSSVMRKHKISFYIPLILFYPDRSTTSIECIRGAN